MVTRRCFESRRGRRLKQLCELHKVVSFLSFEAIQTCTKPNRWHLPASAYNAASHWLAKWLNDTRTRLCPPHPACSSLSSLLWPTNSVHDPSLVRVIRIRVIQNTQFCGDQSKEEPNREVYNMASISYLAHFGLQGWLLRLSVKSTVGVLRFECRDLTGKKYEACNSALA